MVLKGLQYSSERIDKIPVCLNMFIHVCSKEQNIKSKEREREKEEAASDLAPITESNHCSSRSHLTPSSLRPLAELP